MPNKHLRKNYTLNDRTKQLKLPIEMEYMVPKNASVRLLSQIVERIDLTKLYETYERIPKVNPSKMLKIVLYSYMRRIYSTRDIEIACGENINFLYLLEGSKAPDHSTISRFITLHLNQCSEEIMAQLSNYLYEIKEISGENIFIDGTKQEAYANKYTFVWTRAVTKNLAKLLQKLANLVEKCEEDYGIKIIYKNKVKMKHVKRLRKKLYALKKEEGITFVHGRGKRKNPLQRSIEELENYLDKLKEYTKKLHIAGKRKSYSKTDHDATFMRMKDDAMKNGQLKPAYNVQYGVDAEYIVWLTVNQNPGDVNTLVPFLEENEKYLSFKYKNIVTDAGYESEENYVFIEEKKQVAYIKPKNYERSKTRKYKNDISKAENMDYDEKTDSYTCKKGKKLTAVETIKKRSKTGYKSIRTKYICEDCSGCEYKRACIKGNNSKIPFEQRTKSLEISKLFKEKRNESLERVKSKIGCLFMMNRSIQSEGAFGNTKQNMGFRRFQFRSAQNVLAQSILLAMGHNINKLHNKIQKERTQTYLHPIRNAK